MMDDMIPLAASVSTNRPLIAALSYNNVDQWSVPCHNIFLISFIASKEDAASSFIFLSTASFSN